MAAWGVVANMVDEGGMYCSTCSIGAWLAQSRIFP